MTDARFSPNATVTVDSVSKWFGQKVAVSEVTCSFGPGVTGLLGPNGAGKTTLLRMMVGLLSPSEGGLTLVGLNPRLQPEAFRKVAFVAEHDAVYEFQTARRFIEFNAALYGIEDPVSASENAIKIVGLEEAADRKMGTFSKGMRQRAKMAAALVHTPDVLFLDEPLNGTDPVQRAQLIDLIIEMGQAGRTVIVSSHVLHEVERMAGRVIAMVDGRLVAAGPLADLREAMIDVPRRVRIDTDRPRELGAFLIAQGWISTIGISESSLHVDVRNSIEFGHAIAGICRDLDASLIRVEPEDESLESVFRYLVKN